MKEELIQDFDPNELTDVGSKIFFWSDPHFGHKNVIDYSKRPYRDVKEMSRALIENYNNTVPPDGICIWGGDSFFCPKSVAKMIMRKLNGKKILVMGNHDKNWFQMMRLGFDFATYQLKLNIGHKTVTVSHYPWRHHYDPSYKYYDRCPVQLTDSYSEWLIHGHVHNEWIINDNMINVGVDVWNYTPVPLSAIEDIIKKGNDWKFKEGF